jgi:hypothetical protein
MGYAMQTIKDREAANLSPFPARVSVSPKEAATKYMVSNKEILKMASILDNVKEVYDD